MKSDLSRVCSNVRVDARYTGLGWEFSGKSRLAEQSCLKCKKFVVPDREAFRRVTLHKKVTIGMNYWTVENEEACVEEAIALKERLNEQTKSKRV